LNNLPLVSVIVTTYNRASFLSETIDSILYQTYKNFELIVVDDGSTDNTEEAIKMYIDSRLRYIKTNNWGGPAKPRNVGINKAKGEYIAFCDDDDIWEINKLEMQLNIMARNSYNFCCSDILFIDENNKKLNISFIRKISRMFFFSPSYFKLFFSNQIALSSVLISREFLAENKFDEDKNLIACEDYLLWLKLFKKKQIKFYKIKDRLVRYRVLKNSASSNNIRQQILWFHAITKHIIKEKDFSQYPKLILVSIFFAIKSPWYFIANYHLIKISKK